jgi:hypothetical protein
LTPETWIVKILAKIPLPEEPEPEEPPDDPEPEEPDPDEPPSATKFAVMLLLEFAVKLMGFCVPLTLPLQLLNL